MDFIYLMAAATLWAAVVALAFGCERLQPSPVAP